MNCRRIVFYVDQPPVAEANTEVYSISTEHEIDMHLLDDLHRPIDLLVFAGSVQSLAKTFAEKYGGEFQPVSDVP